MLLLSVTGLVILLLGVVGGSYLWLSCQVADTHPTDSSFADVLYLGARRRHRTPTGMDILVLGCDRHPDESGEGVRSDTLMLYTPILRRTICRFCLAAGSACRSARYDGFHKLNAAYSLGGKELAITTVEQLTKVDITEYVEVISSVQ